MLFLLPPPGAQRLTCVRFCRACRHLVKGDNYKASFQETGDPSSSVWSAGTVMGLIDDVPTCKDLVEGMVAEAESIITGRLASMVVK